MGKFISRASNVIMDNEGLKGRLNWKKVHIKSF